MQSPTKRIYVRHARRPIVRPERPAASYMRNAVPEFGNVQPGTQLLKAEWRNIFVLRRRKCLMESPKLGPFFFIFFCGTSLILSIIIYSNQSYVTSSNLQDTIRAF